MYFYIVTAGCMADIHCRQKGMLLNLMILSLYSLAGGRGPGSEHSYSEKNIEKDRCWFLWYCLFIPWSAGGCGPGSEHGYNEKNNRKGLSGMNCLILSFILFSEGGIFLDFLSTLLNTVWKHFLILKIVPKSASNLCSGFPSLSLVDFSSVHSWPAFGILFRITVRFRWRGLLEWFSQLGSFFIEAG